MDNYPKIIAVDFDGTLCVNKFPEIGEPIDDTIRRFIWEKKQGSKMILNTCREGDALKEAVEWCTRNDLIFDAVNDNLPEIIERWACNGRKIFANEYWDDRNVQLLHLTHPDEEVSDIHSWVRREIDIACEREKQLAMASDSNDDDYGIACYKSAYKAHNSLLSDGHSGFSISLTKQILNRLIDGKPLTPITDRDDIWNLVSEEENKKMYQCKRMYSLFKNVIINPDGDETVTFDDVDMVRCIDIHSGSTYSSGIVTQTIHDIYPIALPYSPLDKPIKAYCEDFLAYEGGGDFDTKGIYYVELPDGTKEDINKFFMEGEEHNWIPITKELYEERKELSVDLETSRLLKSLSD